MKACLFDLDNTLIDSMHVWEEAVIRLFDQLSLTMDLEEARTLFGKMKFSEVLHEIKTRFALSQSESQLKDLVIADVKDQYLHHIQPKEGAVAFVKAAKASGYRLCVVTSNDEELTHHVLKRIGILDDFAFVLSAESANLSKQDPLIWETAIKRLHVEAKDCVVFEDSLHAMESAKALGCYVISLVEPCKEEIRRCADECHRDFTTIKLPALTSAHVEKG